MDFTVFESLNQTDFFKERRENLLTGIGTGNNTIIIQLSNARAGPDMVDTE